VSGLATTFVEREEIHRLTLCGSTKFKAEYELWNKRLTLAGFLVYSVSGFGHSGDTFTDEEKAQLDKVHLAKIDASHGIVVVGDGYVGASTGGEIAHALMSGKPVYSTALRLDMHPQTADRVRYVYALRTGPGGPASLRYRAFDWGAALSAQQPGDENA